MGAGSGCFGGAGALPNGVAVHCSRGSELICWVTWGLVGAMPWLPARSDVLGPRGDADTCNQAHTRGESVSGAVTYHIAVCPRGKLDDYRIGNVQRSTVS